MNSMRARPTPSAGSCHQRNAAAGLPTLSITFVRVSGIAPRSTLLASIRPALRVDARRFAFGTRNGHALPVAQHSCRRARTDDRRHAELAAHDGRVRRASAVVGDDRRGALHDRLPIGICVRGHEHRAGRNARSSRASRAAHGPGRSARRPRRPPGARRPSCSSLYVFSVVVRRVCTVSGRA